MSKNIIVIGGGIIGLCSAYYLSRSGHQVTIIDQSNMDSGASYVNAGYLAPSHIIPLAAPGVMKKGLKWMFNSSSPLYIKPRLNLDFLKWAWAFNKSCSPKNVSKAIPIIKDMAILSQELYDDLKSDDNFSFHYEKKGLMMLCQTEKALREEIRVAEIAQREGLGVETLTKEDIRKLEPNSSINSIGATYYTCDYHTTPHEFMEDMKAYLNSVKVVFRPNEIVEDIVFNDRKITSIITNLQEHKADEYVLATGSWSSMLCKKVGLELLLQAGKGYRINTSKDTAIKIPAILTERKIAVTPMNGFTRFAGTMEIGEINHRINQARVNAIADGVEQYYPDIKVSEKEKADAACGLRPLSTDGLPYIGKSSKCNNLTIATGHAMMGWSMATATGKLVQEIIDEQPLSISTEGLSPDRNT